MRNNDYSELERISIDCERTVSANTINLARLHLLDWVGCTLAARNENIAKQLKTANFEPIQISAFLGNLYEMDDVHRVARLHPGPVIWPALFANLPKAGTLEQLLSAAVCGYQAMIDLGEMLDDFHYSNFHPTATCGAFGAACAISKIQSLSKEQFISAGANALSIMGGLWNMRHSRNDTKQWHIFNSIISGQNAAKIAQAGLTGSANIIEGAQGVIAAFALKPGQSTSSDYWHITNTSFKPWAACRHVHPAIDCALELKNIDQLQSESIIIETYDDAILFCDKPSPNTPNEAKFSIQHAIAVIIGGGNCSLDDFTDDAISRYRKYRANIILRPSPEFNKNYPEHFGARIICGGSQITLFDCLGDKERPVSEDIIFNKFEELCKWGEVSEAISSEIKQIVMVSNDAERLKNIVEELL